MIDIFFAGEIAKKLAVLEDFPKLGEAVAQVAELIQRVCSNEERAEWLLAELTLTGKYSKWGGPGWLKAIYDEQFGGPSPNALPVYELDKSYEPMTDAEREEYAAMERGWLKGKTSKPLPAEKPAGRDLTEAELAALMSRTPDQIREVLTNSNTKVKVTQ